MSAQIKIPNINTHVIDILANVSRDQTVMKMDKAVELVKCLDKEVFTSDEYVFFDPFCKAGEILLATALVSMLYKSKKHLVRMDTVHKEMYKTNRYFALAPDKRHYNLSLRTFYGNEKSHDPKFTENIKNGAYLSETDGRLDKNKFNKELLAMLEYIKEKAENKKIIAIGNPPYQEQSSKNTTGTPPIYPYLVEATTKHNDINQILFVIPSRWFNGGGFLQDFLEWVMNCNQIKKIKHFENSRDIFSQVNISGGVCFFNWINKKVKSRKTELFFLKNKITSILSKNFKKYRILLFETEAYGILEKIENKFNTYISQEAWPVKPFGLRTNYFKKHPSLPKNHIHAIPCYKQKRQILYANKLHITKNQDKINQYKVACPATYGAKRVPPKDQFFIISKGEICLETYNIICSFKNRKEADMFLDYINTCFVRFLLGLAKNTQRIVRDHWRFIPNIPFKNLEIQSCRYSSEIFDFFQFTKKEIKYIEKNEKLWSKMKV